MNIGMALAENQSGVVITLDVSAGSKKTVFPSGFNEWRKALLCRINAPPVEGKANKEIICAISDFFSVPQSDVSIIKGATSSQKRVLVKNISLKDASELLTKILS
ncbi:DUF167 domain-containing protein [Methanomicrobium antiquum]|uniref:UPF0235 protein L1994_06245 n=1 Tax=Methanomicrobium antiquum TaxID=487686 RepID=A0AAF0FPY5_9EURY|nr:DUF167 domain-containing protein [Methanomicrobium antiquum]MDD3978308.1 DUF167 domain-containing protein [Methanomicrobium sp.]WFN35766.1 DUF167 domain-containing protein [Methanomicrobium antiquum]